MNVGFGGFLLFFLEYHLGATWHLPGLAGGEQIWLTPADTLGTMTPRTPSGFQARECKRRKATALCHAWGCPWQDSRSWHWAFRHHHDERGQGSEKEERERDNLS